MRKLVRTFVCNLAYSLLALAIPAASFAQYGPWMALVGDPKNSSVDTVELDADSVFGDASTREIAIRVNRATERDGRAGKFRSYKSIVVVHCDTREAFHATQSFYAQPLWKGDPKTLTYPDARIYKMAFVDIAQNPARRIIDRTCSLPNVGRLR